MHNAHLSRIGLLFLVLLAFLLVPVSRAQKLPPSVHEGVERIIVVGDIHGDYDQLIEVLRSAEVIDERNRWIAGRTHLVQLGDLPDRGPDTLKAFEFLKKLESQARRKRGRVHVLIGNHDAMNMWGNLKYVTPEEYAAFVNRNSERNRDYEYQETVKWIRKNVPEEEWPDFEGGFEEEWYAERPLGWVEHRWEWSPQGDIGKWILGHLTVLKINDTLFLHGGLGPAYADLTIDEINETVQAILKKSDRRDLGMVHNEEGPLWYRGLALHPEETETEHLERLLEHFGVNRIVLGHTVTRGAIIPRFDGRVILADVGLTAYYGGRVACVLIEGDQAWAIHRGTKVELPRSNNDVLPYLREVAALDPEPSPVLREIRAREQSEDSEPVAQDPI
jgi:hypothetical protein